jgi:predicted metalloprotease
LAHEVGHHVQNLVGTLDEVNRVRRSTTQEQANALSVGIELQADCYAGVWAHHADRARNILEVGDVDEAMRAASAVGDDTLQRRSQGHVVPDSFTHGSAEQRMRWFALGLETGSIERCNTFADGGNTVSGF